MIDKLLNCTATSDHIQRNDYDCILKKDASCNPEDENTINQQMIPKHDETDALKLNIRS